MEVKEPVKTAIESKVELDESEESEEESESDEDDEESESDEESEEEERKTETVRERIEVKGVKSHGVFLHFNLGKGVFCYEQKSTKGFVRSHRFSRTNIRKKKQTLCVKSYSGQKLIVTYWTFWMGANI